MEPELSITRRAFPAAQQLLAGPVDTMAAGSLPIGWHDTSVSGETGATAVVRRDGPYEDLIGEILRVQRLDARSAARRLYGLYPDDALYPDDDLYPAEDSLFDRSLIAFVYVVGGGDVLTEVSLSRQAFLSIGALAEETILTSIGVVR